MASNTGKSTPRDAQVMAAILKDSGVVEYEPRLIHQMLDFTYQYVTDVLEDAKVYSQHANKKTIDVEDVKLAVQCRTDHSFTNPPPKELLQEMARQKNSQPLPPIKAYGGPRSMSDRYCLTNPNFKLKSSKKPLSLQPQSRIQFGLPTQPRIALPTQAKGLSVKGLGNSAQSVTVLPKANPSGSGATNQVTIMSKPVSTPKPTIRINTGPNMESSKPDSKPKVIFRINTGARSILKQDNKAAAVGIGASGLAQIVTQTTPISSSVSASLPHTPSTTESSASGLAGSTGFGMMSTMASFNPLKRKADDDDYDG